MVKWKELSRLPKSRAFTSPLLKQQTHGSPTSILQPHWRPSSKPGGEQYVEPTHPATQVAPITFPRVRGHGLEIRLVPQACLAKVPVLFPFQREYITWEQRVAWVKDQGYTAKWVDAPDVTNSKTTAPRNLKTKNDQNNKGTARRRLPVLVDKEGNIVGADGATPTQLYPPLDENTHVFPARRAQPQGFVRKLAIQRLQRRVPMAVMIAMSKDRMGSKRYQRQRLVKMIKQCLGWIIGKGAYCEEELSLRGPSPIETNKKKKGGLDPKRGGPREDVKVLAMEEHPAKPKPILFNEAEAATMGRKWAMQGWTYVVFPSTSLYLMPYSRLITILRNSLQFLYARAVAQENNWFAYVLATNKGSTAEIRNQRTRHGPNPSSGKTIPPPSVDVKARPSDSTTTQVTMKDEPADDVIVQKPSTDAIRGIDTPRTSMSRKRRSSTVAGPPPLPIFTSKEWRTNIKMGLQALKNHQRLASPSGKVTNFGAKP